MNRFREVLYVHWKAVRWILAPFVVFCFGLPMMILRLIQEMPEGIVPSAGMFLQYQNNWTPFFPILAFLTGGAVALTAWSWDHQLRHVYALSLPVTRAQYALTKYGAGIVLLAIPVIATLAGTLLALLVTPIPSELHGYPFSLTARFMLAMLLSYSVVFSLASSTVKTTVSIILVVVIVFMAGDGITSFINTRSPDRHLVAPSDLLIAAVLIWPGPLSVFGGNWLIIDV
jgi:hypothetical protein